MKQTRYLVANELFDPIDEVSSISELVSQPFAEYINLVENLFGFHHGIFGVLAVDYREIAVISIRSSRK